MKDYKGVLLTPTLPRDDNEFARYLAQYIIDHETRWYVEVNTENEQYCYLDRERLEEVIAEFMGNQF